ncbi:hypothetical protein ILUMI_04696 [Ignelater luminosus]|uniref:Uncharacterized protein n=1 Tax=Ignelater luminosus TaxID=2038154 RepID=A0A8K0D8G7_IGNLU|nr:hypothetical protein ILUMI_04696 [Ignelater luminosus]
MAGQYNGIQVRFKEKYTCALFIPCPEYNLNLVSGQAAGCIMEATDFFQFLQKLYTFFANSTHRWSVLKESLGSSVVVKRLSYIRWSARSDAISALQNDYSIIMNAVKTIEDNHEELPETQNESHGILKKMETLNTVLLTEIRSTILSKFIETSKSVLNDSLPLGLAFKLIDPLVCKGSKRQVWRLRSYFEKKF